MKTRKTETSTIICWVLLSCMLVAYVALWVYSGRLMESQAVESQTVESQTVESQTAEMAPIRNLVDSQTVESQTVEMVPMRNLITIK